VLVAGAVGVGPLDTSLHDDTRRAATGACGRPTTSTVGQAISDISIARVKDPHKVRGWGQAVSAADAGWNRTIAAGGTAAFGFQASFGGTDAKPTAFRLNRTACAVV
jgi:Cellulose binding domain